MRMFSVFLAALWLQFAAAASAQVTLLTGDDYAPFTDSNLPEGGMATEVVRTAFTRMGEPLDILFRPWERGMVETKAGKYLATFPWSYNDERNVDFAYSDSLYSFNQYFFTKAGSEMTDLEDATLQGKKVCLAISYTTAGLDDWVERGVIELVRPPEMPACFRMLQAGRVDLIRLNNVIAEATIKSEGLDRSNFSFIDTPVRETVQRVMFSRVHPRTEELLPAFDAMLNEMKSDGTIDAIMARHLDLSG